MLEVRQVYFEFLLLVIFGARGGRKENTELKWEVASKLGRFKLVLIYPVTAGIRKRQPLF
jgi:hypothetical protein